MEVTEIIQILGNGGVGVLPTDTLYGLVGQALNEKAVARIFELKDRPIDKPFIILINKLDDLKKFGIQLTPGQEKRLREIWPNQVTVILPISDEKFDFLSRGKSSLAFRLPKDELLQRVLPITGPLVAPSANPTGEIPAETIDEARGYFGDRLDFYFDKGELSSLPSTIVKFDDSEMTILREGAVKI